MLVLSKNTYWRPEVKAKLVALGHHVQNLSRQTVPNILHLLFRSESFPIARRNLFYSGVPFLEVHFTMPALDTIIFHIGVLITLHCTWLNWGHANEAQLIWIERKAVRRVGETDAESGEEKNWMEQRVNTLFTPGRRSLFIHHITKKTTIQHGGVLRLNGCLVPFEGGPFEAVWRHACGVPRKSSYWVCLCYLCFTSEQHH